MPATEAIRALEQLTAHLVRASRESASPLPLQTLMAWSLEFVERPGAADSSDTGPSIHDIVSALTSEETYRRSLDKTVSHAFLMQIPVDFDAERNIRAAVEEVESTLRQTNRKEEVSARLSAVLDDLAQGLEELSTSAEALFTAGDRAFSLYKSLGDERHQHWQVAKDAYRFKNAIDRRRELFAFQRRLFERQLTATSLKQDAFVDKADVRTVIQAPKTTQPTMPDLIAELEASLPPELRQTFREGGED